MLLLSWVWWSICNDEAHGVCNKNTTLWKKSSFLHVSQEKEHFLTLDGAHWVTKNEHPVAYIKMTFLALESQKNEKVLRVTYDKCALFACAKNEQPYSWNYNKLQLKSTSKMKYKNFGNKKSADICETNPCVMGLKYMSELRSARTNPFHEWLEDVAVVRRALHLCVKVPVGGILPQLQEVDCLFIQSSSSQLSSCSPLPWLVMFGESK